MKFLGIDFGTKRIGLAVSDENASFAFPKEVISNDIKKIENISKLIKHEQIGEIVIGKSLDSNGDENIVSKNINDFILDLKKEFQIPIHEEKEFFTSMHAHGTRGKEANSARQTIFKKVKGLDAKAAALILQRYLDKKK